MTEIAAASAGDIKAIAAIEAACADNPWSEAQLLEELGQPHARLLRAGRDGVIAGFLDMHIVADDAHINELAVKEEYRRSGVASALISGACDMAKAAGCGSVSLEARSKNAAALGLYESAGFVRAGVRKRLYSSPVDDGIIMVKTFTEKR